MKIQVLKYLCVLHFVFCMLGLTGCEWTGGAGVDSWDDSGNWVDFSGNYKAPDGGILVRQFGATNTVTTNTTWTTNTVANENLGVGDGTKTAFNGQTAHTPVRGSLTIFTVGGYRFTDSPSTTEDTVSLAVTPADGSAGVFNYSTRAWALQFPAPLANGTQILGTYQYASATSVINPVQGNHGSAIYSFVVYQTGNKIQIIDSNGARYEGSMGTVRTTSGKVLDANDPTFVQPTVGDVVAQFSATGVSQGYQVTLVGVLQGTISASSPSLNNRRMQATFIEQSGNEADVNATAN